MPLAPDQPGSGVLFITPEIHPLNKTGGLGDVSAALPAALRELKVDVRLLIPGYPQVLSGPQIQAKIAEFTLKPRFRRRRCYRQGCRWARLRNSLYSSLIARTFYLPRRRALYGCGRAQLAGQCLAFRAAIQNWRHSCKRCQSNCLASPHCALQRLAKRSGARISPFSFGGRKRRP